MAQGTRHSWLKEHYCDRTYEREVKKERNVLWRYNPIDVEDALRAATPAPPFPPVSDRAAWVALAAAMPDAERADLIAQAETAAQTAIPALPATLFLEFVRTGQREGYQQPRQLRRSALAALTLAECLEDRGRFLDPILDWAWAICEESSWVLPAHQRVLTDVEHPVVDLGVAMTGLELAECDHLVGGRLDPALGKRIRDEVKRRCIEPFLTRHDFWWLHRSMLRDVNNWTAVCVGGVVGAATYLETNLARLAEVIARGCRSLEDYLATFDVDGGSSEGPGYWSYGFGYFTIVAHLVELRTNGHVRLMDDARIQSIAQYPLRTLLSPGHFVNFSDCDRDVRLIGAHLSFLARRLELPDLMPLAQAQPRRETDLAWWLRSLRWRPDPSPEATVPPSPHDYFSGMQWMVARENPTDANALVLAVKGGHNQEMHNQNDVGTFIVHVGGESLIADLGRGRYTKSYFGPERYDHLVNSSFGHAVPIVNGHGQPAGRPFAAALIEHRSDEREDVLVLDLQAAYPRDAGVTNLRRTVALHRYPPDGWVSVDDVAVFTDAPGTLESVLLTFGRVDLREANGEVWVHGRRVALRIGYDQTALHARAETIPDVDLAEGPTTVWRIRFVPKEQRMMVAIALRIEPFFHAKTGTS